MRSQTRWRFLTSKNTALYPSEAEKAEFKSATYVPAHVLPMSPVCTLKAVLQTSIRFLQRRNLHPRNRHRFQECRYVGLRWVCVFPAVVE